MRLAGIILTPLLGILLATGCLERTDRDLPVANAATQVNWELAGSWGGNAEIIVDSPDPWQVRFANGTFVNIAGICATDSEVWVCDTGISRLQVFDFDGEFQRSIGEGMPLAEQLPTVLELFRLKQEQADDAPSWLDEHAARWVGYDAERFRATDVAVTANGYFVLDQTRLAPSGRSPRDPNLRFFPFEGEMQEAADLKLFWPEYLAVRGNQAAFSQPMQNEVNLLFLGNAKWVNKPIGTPTANVSQMLDIMLRFSDLPNYQLSLDMFSDAGSGSGQFDHCSGLALAFDKLVVCDTRNRRLKIYDARRGDPLREGQLVKIIGHQDIDNTTRFDAPRDIDFDHKGLSYILDENRLEVGVLDQAFNRIGTFGRGDLLEPHALDLSDDGKHCFVTDRRYNKVWHYVRVD